jgi:L-ascorbate metabolism protein UlaG (beta-lactamase superfamily)
MSGLVDGVTWFRRSSIRIRRGGTEIHVDPWGVAQSSAAEFILLTHPHYDNFSEEDVARVRDARTLVIAPASMKWQLGDADHFLRPGDLLHLDGLDVLAVPAYNLEKRYHPPDAGWLGYVFTTGDVTYYHAGDTDYLNSMADIRCDVAFLPCEGNYTMGSEDAARAGVACGASVVVPIHWGDADGSRSQAERVQELFPGEVVLLDRGIEYRESAPH